MSRGGVLIKKSFDFAIRVINLYKYLRKDHKEYIVSQQLFRSGTAIGALIHEAEHGESRKDFLHKLNIALKEANESVYWLELLYAAKYIDEKMFNSMMKDAVELLKLLIASVKTTKRRSVTQ